MFALDSENLLDDTYPANTYSNSFKVTRFDFNDGTKIEKTDLLPGTYTKAYGSTAIEYVEGFGVFVGGSVVATGSTNIQDYVPYLAKITWDEAMTY